MCQFSVGDVQGAAQSALAVGHLRLGIMIARAAESPKDDLRADAEAQLMEYGLLEELEDDAAAQVLELEDNDTISVDERMVLLLLAGHIAPVARKLSLSWYRGFIMHLLYGAGCVDLPLPQRVMAAVNGVEAW